MNKRNEKLSIALSLAIALSGVTTTFATSVNTDSIERVFGKDNKINVLKNKNFVQGFENGDLKLDSGIKRSEITKLLAYANGQEEVSKTMEKIQGSYNDVNISYWANGLINAATQTPVKSNGLFMIKGYPDGSFKPENNITYAELAKMLVVLSDSTLTAEDVANFDKNWPANWVDSAQKAGLLEDIDLKNVNKEVNREEAFTMFYNGLYKINGKEIKKLDSEDKDEKKETIEIKEKSTKKKKKSSSSSSNNSSKYDDKEIDNSHKEPDEKDEFTETLEIKGLNTIYVMVSGIKEDNSEKIMTLEEAKKAIDEKYSVQFNSEKIKLEGNTLTVSDGILSKEDWNKIKAQGNKALPYKITILKGMDKRYDKVAKIAMYEDGKVSIEELELKEDPKKAKEESEMANALKITPRKSNGGTDNGGIGIRMTLPKDKKVEDFNSIEIELLKDDKSLVINKLQYGKINDNIKSANAIDSPFNFGTKGNRQWAWDRGPFDIGEKLTDDNIPNKVKVNIKSDDIEYTFEKEFSVEMEELTQDKSKMFTAEEDKDFGTDLKFLVFNLKEGDVQKSSYKR